VNRLHEVNRLKEVDTTAPVPASSLVVDHWSLAPVVDHWLLALIMYIMSGSTQRAASHSLNPTLGVIAATVRHEARHIRRDRAM